MIDMCGPSEMRSLPSFETSYINVVTKVFRTQNVNRLWIETQTPTYLQFAYLVKKAAHIMDYYKARTHYIFKTREDAERYVEYVKEYDDNAFLAVSCDEIDVEGVDNANKSQNAYEILYGSPMDPRTFGIFASSAKAERILHKLQEYTYAWMEVVPMNY